MMVCCDFMLYTAVALVTENGYSPVLSREGFNQR